MDSREHGFTIVEMIIVVVVIAVLAMITVFAFNSYRTRTAKTEMQNELLSAVSTVKSSRIFGGAYPVDATAFASVYKSGSSTVTLTYSTTDSGATNFCLAATSPTNAPGVTYYIASNVWAPTTVKPSPPCP